MIIVFSGVDCAGKSTQIEILKKEFLSDLHSVTIKAHTIIEYKKIR